MISKNIRTKVLTSQLRLEKITLDSKIQKALITTQRLSRYHEELETAESEFMAHRKKYGLDPAGYDAKGKILRTHPQDKYGKEIPVPLREKLYAWFSGRY
jgi:hypothetical protein